MTVRIRGTDIQYPDGSLQSSYTVTGPTGPGAATGATGPTGVGTNYSNANVAGYLSGSVTVGNITATGTIAMASSFKRNLLINGNMQIWQRGTSFTNVGNAGVPQYTVDRWFGYRVGNNDGVSISQQTGFSGFQYCARVSRAASDTRSQTISFAQIIESVNMYDLAGQTVTVSFYARAGANFSATSGILSAAIYTGTVADGTALQFSANLWTGQTSSFSSNATLTTTATRYTVTGTISASAAAMCMYFSYTPVGTAGAADYVEITGVQLEVSSAATPYERQVYSDQLAQCQRYYEVVGGSAFVNYTLSGVPTIAMYCYKTQKRVTPTSYGIISGNFNTMTVAYGGVSYVDLGYSGSTLSAGVTFVGTGFVSAEL